ncbi:uncharacterized protein TM35_000043840 [Trypanosoma theileri]|uniref:Uncharacterized protein n=1 Tax=Trypanosoma theileri TaxID=67003 RepID=A0A1X0P6W0_9TRYP|nr:uncharacterized protein TM35_000043840 [Trypanosoma theileri]ORC92170.1 hypothetical protein TM35_000043840 [Trypanosoma theileri]
MSPTSDCVISCGDYCCDVGQTCCVNGCCHSAAGVCRAEPSTSSLTAIAVCGAIALLIVFICMAVATRRRAAKLRLEKEADADVETAMNTTAMGAVEMNTAEERGRL